MTSSPKSLLSACVILSGLLLFTMSLSGCIKNIFAGGEEGGPPLAAKLSPLDEGRTAYVKGDYKTAESLSLRLIDDSSLSKSDSAEAGRLLAASALQTGHPSVAITGLEHWRTAAPGADTRKEWQDAWCRSLRSLSSHDARTRANDVYQDASRSIVTRGIAGAVFAVRQWQDGELGQSMAALENIYTSLQSKGEKALIEGRLATELSLASAEAVALIASAPTPENQGRFPYSIILIDKLRRQVQAQATRVEAEAALDALSKQISLADPSLFKGLPPESSITIQAPGPATPVGTPVTGRPVVLVLPLGGQYAAISGKLAAGAQAVCDELSASGNKVSLVVIDSDQPDWIAKVDALPGDVAIIGGPLRRDDYTKAKAQGLTSRRALFAFLPGLESGDEGRIAWRFFPSAKDQVDTLLAFTSRLGISGYGVFYPEENFGQRMSALFEERASASGAKKVVKASYTPGDSNNWMAAASKLVSANNTGTAFQAVFLPDTWKNIEAIVPNFFYYNETRQVLMGTSLWEQGLTGNSVVSSQYYGLAVFPGSWNPAKPAAQKLQSRLSAAGKGSADFWTGLGADFARLSATSNLRDGWTPASLNSALQGVSFDWTTAPITWSGGMASQQMLLFTPKQGGFAPVNEDSFRGAFQEAWR